MLYERHIAFRRRSEEGELVYRENFPLVRETNDTEEGRSHGTHGICPAPTQKEVVSKICINDLNFHFNGFPFQSNRQSLKDTIGTRLSPIKGF